MTGFDFALIVATLGTLACMRRTDEKSESKFPSVLLLPAFAIMCVAISLGPAHVIEMETALAAEYNGGSVDPNVKPSSSARLVFTRLP